MSYKQALKEAERTGASKADGLAHLAQVCFILSRVHAVSPELIYNGAVKRRLTARQVAKLDPIALGDLMFV